MSARSLDIWFLIEIILTAEDIHALRQQLKMLEGFLCHIGSHCCSNKNI